MPKFAKKCNLRPFVPILKPSGAYVLGLLFTDGNLYKKKTNSYMVQLQSTDEEICTTAERVVKSKNKIYKRPSNHEKNWKAAYSWYCHDNRFTDILLNFGIVERKSTVIQFPNIDNKILSHFVRGCIDGDGSILKSGKYDQLTITLCSASKQFLIDLNNSIPYKSNHLGYSSQCWRLIWKSATARNLAQWLYKDSLGLRLNRKYERYKLYANF